MVRIINNRSITAFFAEKLDEAVAEKSLQLLDLTRSYMVDLLTEFTDSEVAFSLERDNAGEPLSIRFLRATDKSAGEKVRDYKMIGDFCLFLSGFFPDYIHQKIVDPGFYISIGSSAYSKVESSLKQSISRREESFVLMYGELADKFPDLVDLYMVLSERMVGNASQNLIKIYEKYLLFRSRRHEKILLDAGIEPPPIVRTKH